MKKYNLDLHGVRHADVSRKIDKFIGEHLMNGTKSVIIITGNSDEMKRLVNKALIDYGMNYDEIFGKSGEVSVSLV